MVKDEASERIIATESTRNMPILKYYGLGAVGIARPKVSTADTSRYRLAKPCPLWDFCALRFEPFGRDR